MKEIFTMDLKGKLLIAVVFMVLGFMLSVQYKTTELQRNVRMDRVEDLSERLKVMEAENKQLLTELETLRAGAAKDPADDRMKLMAGTTDVEGEGIEILLDDSNIAKKSGENPNLYIIHDEDLLRVLNELRAAGAEAISVNGSAHCGYERDSLCRTYYFGKQCPQCSALCYQGYRRS